VAEAPAVSVEATPDRRIPRDFATPRRGMAQQKSFSSLRPPRLCGEQILRARQAARLQAAVEINAARASGKRVSD